ncbi:MAG: hypothetical protein Kow0075_05120 [Salibacteraceae bacterium]
MNHFRYIILSLLIFGLLATKGKAQSLSVKETGDEPHPSAMLDVESTAKGILIPRMTMAHRLSIVNPAQGLIVFQTDSNSGLWIYDTLASGWEPIHSGNTLAGLDSILRVSSNAGGDTIYNLAGLALNAPYTGKGQLVIDTVITLQAGDTGGFSTIGFNSYFNSTGNYYLNNGSASVLASSKDFIGLYLWPAGLKDSLLPSNPIAFLELATDSFVRIKGLRKEYAVMLGSHVFIDSLSVGIVSPYGFPGSDGTNGQVLTTNGLGRVNWQHINWKRSLPDTLGFHLMRRNMVTDGNWISGDGDNEGLQIDFSGRMRTNGGLYHHNNTTGNHLAFKSNSSVYLKANDTLLLKGGDEIRFNVPHSVSKAIINSTGLGIGMVPDVDLSVLGKGKFNNNLVAAPSTGVNGGSGDRLILYPGTATAHPFSLGINSFTLWYSVPSSSAHKWYVGGNEYLQINSQGYVGVNTANPQDQLHISGNLRFEQGSDVTIYMENRTVANNSGNSITLKAGNGATTGYGVNGGDVTIQAGDAYNNGGAGSGGEVYIIAGGNTLVSQNPGHIIFSSRIGTTTTERMRIVGDNGYVGIGVTNPTHILHVNGIARSTSTLWAVTSDIRSKQNIRSIAEGLNVLMQLRPVTFEWKPEFKEKYNDNKSFHYGFISQEVEKIIPEMITETVEVVGNDTISDFKLLNSEPLIPLLVRAIQEQQAQIDELKHELELLRQNHSSETGSEEKKYSSAIGLNEEKHPAADRLHEPTIQNDHE